MESGDEKKEPLETDEESETEYPTVRPSFDPSSFAADTEHRQSMPTITDEAMLEEARLLSAVRTDKPPPAPVMSTAPPVALDPRDSACEVDLGEADVDALDDDEQLAILSARLAPLRRVPKLAKELGELGTLLADPKTAYVLGFVDGLLPLETIVEVTGLPELDTLRILDRMIAQSIVVFR